MPRNEEKLIWIDLDNSPHVPFFYPIIRELKKKNFKVLLTARDCFQVCSLADLLSLQYKKIGRHYGKHKLLKVWGTVLRSLQLLPIALREKPVMAISHGSRSQLLASSLLKIPFTLILDYEYTAGLVFVNPNWFIIPEVIPETSISSDKRHILKYPGIKEDVYVSGYKPDSSFLKDLGLYIDDFIVTIRPPATEAHYHNPESELLFVSAVGRLVQNPEIKIVILPRNEIKQTAWIKNKWSSLIDNGTIIIPNKVVNGLDLIWYSDFVISGGGTMNREAAALGVPVYSIFRGTIGAVDHYLSDTGRLTLLESSEDIKTKLKLSRRNKTQNYATDNRPALDSIVNHISNIFKTEIH